jgi:hypothetical protein
VGQHADLEIGGGDRGGQRVDQERHVVGDDQQRGPVVALLDGQLEFAGQALLSQFQMRLGGGEHLSRGAAGEFLIGHEAPEPVNQFGQLGSGPAGRRRHRHRLRYEPLQAGCRLVDVTIAVIRGGCRLGDLRFRDRSAGPFAAWTGGFVWGGHSRASRTPAHRVLLLLNLTTL